MTHVAKRSSDACQWCRAQPARPGGRFCSRRCRQSAFRLRRRYPSLDPTATPATSPTPGRFAYADPPYPGLARKFYRGESSLSGRSRSRRADRVARIRRLRWLGALNGAEVVAAGAAPLSARRSRLRLVQAHWRVAAHLRIAQHLGSRDRRWRPPANAPAFPDWLRAMPARGGGTLMGRKPIAFCAWLFDLLGMLPGDELVDLFPGTGIVTRAWAELSSYQRPRLSFLEERRGRASA